jgi:DHA2 family multidrug resistance protein-like MFS transporter
MALGVALLRFVVAPSQLGAAIGWNALTVAISSAAGPTIGAAILSVSSWPFLFAVNLPLGVAALFAARALPRVVGSGRVPDLLSVALHVMTFACLIIGTELLPIAPALAAILFFAAASCLIALVSREAPKTAPLIPFELLRAPLFRVSVIASVLCFAGQTAGLLALPFYLQHSLGQNEMMTGFYLTFWPLAVAITAPFAGRLADLVSTTRLCTIGGLALAVGLGAASLCPLQGDPWPLIPITLLCGFGFGLFNVSNNRNMFLSAPRERGGAAGGVQGTARLVGQSAGAVIMSMLFTLTSVEATPKIALGVGAALTLAAAVVSGPGTRKSTASRR